MSAPTPDEVGLRPATPADATVVASLHLASRQAAPMPPGIHPEHEVHEYLAGRLASDDEVWLAECDGSGVAYARFTDTWLDDLYVAPEHAGRGIGGMLLDLVKARRPEGFCLWVFETNAPARGFYRRHGLVELERTDGRGNEERAPDVRMAWPGTDPLGFYRRLIDEVDGELGDLLARRVALTRAVQACKPGPGRDRDRERAIAEALAGQVPELGVERLSRIIDAIITESLDAAGQKAEITK